MKNIERKRLANWWMCWEDLNWPNPDVHDRIKKRAEEMADASVTTAILFGAHFRWDYLPYFTILHDYIATVAEELHERGVELYDRHSVNLIHRYDTREEMRHVILHSGPHLPFSPSREAAASWEYKGKRLNDWRMIDVRDRSVLYYPHYAAEGFCHRNPEFVEAYCDYAKQLVADTGIDGISAEDPVHYMNYISCGCPHCRAELKKRAGIDLPPIEDRSFWGNWDNPAWRHWIDLRYDSATEFYDKLRPCLPEDFVITGCGGNSALPNANGKASDARSILPGSNYVHMEMCGNTPPYKHDPVTVNSSIMDQMVNASQHQAAAIEAGVRSFSTGYGFTEPSANIIWAVNKMLDVDCLFSTLKARLGLPDHILKTLPDEPEVIKRAFDFEKNHPELFCGEQIKQVGVYFSYETHHHTCFGNLIHGYYADYSASLRLLYSAGISTNTVFEFPENAEEFGAILVPSALAMTEEEHRKMKRYAAAGGKVIITGPTSLPGCVHTWEIPSRPTLEDPKDFFSTIAYGVWHKDAAWITDTVFAPSKDPDCWQKVEEGILYDPHRISDGAVCESVLELCRKYGKPLPVKVLESKGYLITMFQSAERIVVQFLAEDYDTDIDHHLDEIRFHRSRMNYVNKVEPAGVDQNVLLKAEKMPKIYLPFNEEDAVIREEDDVYHISLPEKTSYFILSIDTQ